MTEPPTEVRSWINKGKNELPDWAAAHVEGGRDPNGSFLIRTKIDGDAKNARVVVGNMLIERHGVAYTRPPAEARSFLQELADEETKATAHSAVLDDDAEAALPVDNEAGIGVGTAPESRTQKRQASAEKRQSSPRTDSALSDPRRQPARGSMPSIEWIQLDRLEVDDSYQRSIETGPSRALIQRIGREWDWRLCVPLMVSRRADGLFVIDGQHRLRGAQQRDDVPQLPCCISVYGSQADEAAMFVAANRERRAINRLDDFHAAQAGGDGDARAIAGLIESVGFKVSRKTGSAAWAPGEVAFTSAIAGVRRKHGDGVVRDALQAMADAFPDERLVAGSSVFMAICRVLVAPPASFDRDRLFKALLKFDMKGWASFLAQTKGGDTRALALRDMLLAAYDDLGRELAA